MKVVNGLTDRQARIAPSVLTVGNFDGVHRGHRAIIRTARSLADANALPVVVLTFEPHPSCVLRPDRAPQRLGTVDQKLAALAEAGADAVIIAESTPQLFAIAAETFLREQLIRTFNPRFIVEGNNFRFGHDRTGDVETLRRFEAQGGYRTEVVSPVMQPLDNGATERISSSLVRRLLLAGKVEAAAEALGRPYELIGEVVRGADRGRSLGFPTANLQPGDVLVPADGVYAGTLEIDGRTHSAAVSIGSTPTFAHGKRQIEAHMLDYDGDLYSRTLRLRFTHHLREQRSFASVDDLITQVRADIARVRELAP